MNTGTLSAIWYSHNSARTIPGALDALLRASVSPTEIIVIDDASHDTSVRHVNGYLGHHPEIRLIRNREQLGQAASLSRALRVASGEYLHAATADARVLPALFEEALTLLQHYPQAGFCSADAERCDQAGRVTGAIQPRWGGMSRYVSPEDFLDLIQTGEVDLGATVFNREVLVAQGGFLRELEGIAPWFALLVTGFRHGLCYLPKVLATSRASTAPRPGTVASAQALAQLVRLMLAYAHPITTALFWDAPHFSRWPSHLYWRVGRDGLLARCFHLHPLMVRPVRRDVLPSTTIDDQYVTHACPDPADVYVVKDSDEMVGVSLNAKAEDVGEMRPESASVFRVVGWAREATTHLQRELATHRIRFHAGDLGAEWEPVERASDDVIESLLFFFRGLSCPEEHTGEPRRGSPATACLPGTSPAARSLPGGLRRVRVVGGAPPGHVGLRR